MISATCFGKSFLYQDSVCSIGVTPPNSFYLIQNGCAEVAEKRLKKIAEEVYEGRI